MNASKKICRLFWLFFAFQSAHYRTGLVRLLAALEYCWDQIQRVIWGHWKLFSLLSHPIRTSVIHLCLSFIPECELYIDGGGGLGGGLFFLCQKKWGIGTEQFYAVVFTHVLELLHRCCNLWHFWTTQTYEWWTVTKFMWGNGHQQRVC